MKETPSVFEYTNYREFLRDLCAALKIRDRKFSLRYFARVAGFSSHNFLPQVLRGESDLSDESISKFSKFFKLSREEDEFFRALVLFNQAKTAEAKQAHAEEILSSKSFRTIHPLSDAQYQFFKHWYFSVVRELVALKGFREDPVWLAGRIVPPIQPAEVSRAIAELLKLGLLKRDGSGQLVQANPKLSTPDEVASSHVAGWHRQYIQKAAESIELIPKEKRDISAVSFGISSAHIDEIKKAVQKFRKELLDIAASASRGGANDDSTAQKDALFQLNIQLFPLAFMTSSESEALATEEGGKE